MASSNRFTSWRPPRSANADVLFSIKNSRVALGSTSFKPARKSLRVTCSAPRSADAGAVSIGSERHGARVDFQDLQPRLRVGNSDFNFAIEAPGPPQRRVQNLGNIGGAH